MNRQHGLFFSILIHVLILLIPLSAIVRQHIQDVELLVTLEDAHMRREPVKKQRETKIVKERATPAEVPVSQEKKEEIAEPVKEVVQNTDEAPAEKKLFLTVRTDTAEDFSSPIDTEFGAAVAPSFLHREMPVYPVFARKLGKEGKVLLRITIDERGNLLNIEVVEKAGYGFVEAAIDAVKMSTFLPAKKNGKPVASRALLPVRFTLRGNS